MVILGERDGWFWDDSTTPQEPTAVRVEAEIIFPTHPSNSINDAHFFLHNHFLFDDDTTQNAEKFDAKPINSNLKQLRLGQKWLSQLGEPT